MRRRSRRRRVALVAVVCVVGLLVTVFAALSALTRDGRSGATAEPAATQAAGDRPTIAILGESYAGSTAMLSEGGYWGTQLAVRAGASVDLDVRRGAWLTGPATDRARVVDAAAAAATRASVIVLMTSPQDAEPTGRLTPLATATRAISAAKQASPNVTVVVVGPLAVSTDAHSADFRAALRSAADISDSRWVDPIARSWFKPVQASDLLAGRLDAGEQRTIAARLDAVISPLLTSERP